MLGLNPLFASANRGDSRDLTWRHFKSCFTLQIPKPATAFRGSSPHPKGRFCGTTKVVPFRKGVSFRSASIAKVATYARPGTSQFVIPLLSIIQSPNRSITIGGVTPPLPAAGARSQIPDSKFQSRQSRTPSPDFILHPSNFILPFAQSPMASFIAQRHHGIDFGRPACGNVAGHERHGDQDQRNGDKR